MIEAITFDFWDTIAIDDSDEQKRARLGLPSKSEARAQLFVQQVTSHHPHISAQQAAAAYKHANERFNHHWHNEHHTPRVTTRIFYAYEHLELNPPPGRYAQLVREIDELVRQIEEMEIRIPPDFAPDIQPVLAELSREYKLGIISDTIHTHGRGLRHLLERQGILQYFDYFIFSDEVGASKPSTAVFRQAAIGLESHPSTIAHIGDRESNDILGPLSIGMRAILYTGIKDRGSRQTRASAVCCCYRELPHIVRRLR
jgi:putative hydrolase of the HAD superfamily